MAIALLGLLLLIQNATIEGRVVNPDGSPAADVPVTAQAVADAAVLAGKVRTDKDGRYRLENVTPGPHYIAAGVANTPTYYPGVPGVGEARVIPISAGTSVTGIDFRLTRPFEPNLAGRVTNTPGMPDEVRIILGPAPGGFSTRTVKPGKDGAFEFASLVPGAYRLIVRTTDPFLAAFIVPITIGERDITGLDIAFPSQKTVAGRVTFEDPNAAGLQLRLGLSFNGSNSVNFQSELESEGSFIATDGSFVARVPLGLWVLATPSVPGFQVKSVTYGNAGRNALLTVAADDTEELRIVLAQNPTVKVSGRLIDLQNRPGLSRLVLKGPALVDVPLKMPEGTFEIPKVLPGDYSLENGLDWTAFTIPDVNVANFTIRSFVGRVVLESGTLGRYTAVSAEDGTTSASATVAPDGSFVLRLVDGTYRFSISGLPAGSVVKSIRYGLEHASNQTFSVGPGKESEDLIVMIGRPSNP
jgi:hypothetical protein